MRLPFSKTFAAVDRSTLDILALLLAVAAFRLVVVTGLPIWLRPSLLQDDGLFLRLATSLASGDWLGPYGPFTLLKGPGYPAFLAISNLSGLPVSATHALFQITAMAVAAWAVYRLTASRVIAALTFIVLALDPVGFMPDMQRIVAEQIYWAQALLVFSLVTIVLYAPPHRSAPAIAISLLTGAIFGWMWLTGENGLWFLPGLALLTAGAVLIHRNERDALRALARNTGLAAVAFLAVIATVMTANLIAYGVFGVSDDKERNFATALDALQSIEAGPPIRNVPVSNAALAVAAKASPSFKPLNDALADGTMRSTWGQFGCRTHKETCNHYSDGWFVRALRSAAAKSNFYDRPQTAAQYFARIAAEIRAACAAGSLKCRKKGWLGGLAGPADGPWAALGKIADSFSARVAFLDPPGAKVVETSRVDTESRHPDPYWVFLNRPFVSASGSYARATVMGWYYDHASSQWPSFSLYAERGQPLPFSLERRPSPDLQKHYADAQPAWNRFAISYRCPDVCTLVARVFDRPSLRLPLVRDRDLSTQSGSAKLYVDIVSSDWKSAIELGPLQSLAALARSELVWMYELLVPFLLLASLLGLVAACDGAIAARRLSPVLAAAAAAWVLVAARIVALAIPDAGALPDTNFQESAPAAYLAILASCLTFGAVLVQARYLSPRAQEPAAASL